MPRKARAPWEKRPEETEPAWSAFQAYRETGSHIGETPGRRSVRGVCKRLGGSLKVWYEWSRVHKWKGRARAYDAHLDRVALESTEKAIREMHRRHVKLSLRLQDIAGVELAKLADEARAKAKRLGDLRPVELARIAETGVKLERLTRGESTENVAGSGLDLSKLSLTELKTLKALREKAKNG